MLYFKYVSHIHCLKYLGARLQCIFCNNLEIVYLKSHFPFGFALAPINLSNSSDHHHALC